MNEVVTYIPTFIRTVTRSVLTMECQSGYNRVRTHIHGLPLFPPSFIPALSYLFFLYQTLFFFPSYICVFDFTVSAGYLYTTHTLNTNCHGTSFGDVPGYFNSVPDRMHLWPEKTSFIIPSERLSS